jgi:cytidyltransferase-like protein
MISKQLITKKNYTSLKNTLKSKSVGLCHGAFDILHLGHLKHLRQAKNNCDVLIVSLTADEFIKKGPFQPYFNIFQRAEALLSVKYVDYVYISNSETGEESIKLFQPKYYIKGIDYINNSKDYNLSNEKKTCKENQTKILFTKTEKFSSTKILNNFFIKFTDEQKKIIIKIKKKYSVKKIFNIFNRFKKLQFALTGELIIDEYKFVEVIGTATKSPIMTSDFLFREKHLGGSITAAIILSEFINTVHYIIPMNKKSHPPKLRSNVKKLFCDLNFNIIKKTRYVNFHKKNKLFQTNVINNLTINQNNIKKFKNLLNILKNKYPLIILDFGLGLIDKSISEKLSKKNLYLNVQTNSNNYGFNLISKYKNYSYISINLREFELNFGVRINHYKEIRHFINKMPNVPISITLGAKGSVFINKKRELIYCPSFFSNPLDTTGCGDAYFIITSLLVRLGFDNEIVPFIGNCYAGLHSNNFGNSKVPTKKELINTINSFINI